MIPGYQRHQSMSPVLPAGGRGAVLHTMELVVCASFHIAIFIKACWEGDSARDGLLFDKILLKNGKKCS